MSKTGDYQERRKQLRDGDYTVPEGSLCDYGCGLPAHFILMGKEKIEKFCCSRRYLSCPAKKSVGKIPRYANLAGRTFNHLTALNPLGKNKQGAMVWSCRCSCSKENLPVAAADLLRGRVKSCGHTFYHGKSKTVEYMLYHAAKGRAKKRNLPFTLAISDIVIPEICPILGIVIKHHDRVLKEDSPSLERIYPDRGYVLGNVAVISHKANRMKGQCTPEELVALGRRFKELHETIG